LVTGICTNGINCCHARFKVLFSWHQTSPLTLFLKDVIPGRLLHIFAAMRKLSMDELNRKTVHEFKEADKNKIIVVLENIRSMQNVGSVFRTADAFLVESIYLIGYTPQPPHRDIHKTALGATETVSWKYAAKTIDAITELREKGYQVIGIEQAEGSILLHEYQKKTDEKIAIIFGNEAEGIDEETLLQCDACIEIPQLGMKHSLNISVAAGVVLWEMVRGQIKSNF
jgi:23S rRNA (guanosine2251-2'-O)-methyltransferase